ncbi:hypothetical protein NW768_002884 [Fusarium equiseti]|uniref:Transcription factor n=1 Tax=Fusarium equiseti TaxID=61235 RepID=A0ABQ8RKG7_FUSEQ|nr:hypothetical protein NW768_002884 [Fusarium equiseti]
MAATEEVKTDVPSDRPRWLVNIEESIEEELDEFSSESPYYEIVRDMLLAPKDSDTAVPDAVNRFYDLYISSAENERREPPDYMAGFKLNSMASIVFETVRDVFYTTFEHDRLAEFLIGIKKGAAAEYDPEVSEIIAVSALRIADHGLQNPQFVYHGWGLEAIAEKGWNAARGMYYILRLKHLANRCSVDESTKNLATEPEDIWSEAWLNISGLISKLYRGGLLDTDGPIWVSTDLQEALETKIDENVSSDAGRQAQALAAVNHILIAGEVFAKDVKAASETQKADFNAEKWKFWADKMKEIADLVDESARWNLKERAKEGHEMMVELWLE